MATRIYYFTGTGNSLAAAGELASKMGGAEVLPMTAVLNGRSIPEDTDCLGLVFPVYIFGPPLIVREFISRLTVKPDTYIFSVATMGGMACRTQVVVHDDLAARGLALAYSGNVRMPDNYTPFHGALPLAKQQDLFKAASRTLESIARVVLMRGTGKPATDRPLLNFLFAAIYRWTGPRIPGMDEKFTVDQSCSKCGLCAQVCPARNIVMTDGKPVWQHRCQQCLACLHFCPVAAIQHGKKTRGRQRYHHPQASAVTLRNQADAK